MVRDQKVAGSNPVTSTKACQEMSFPGRLFSTLCTKRADNSGFRRFPCVTDCEGFCRILSDYDSFFSREQTVDVIVRNQQKSTVANGQRRRFSNMGRKNKTVWKCRLLAVNRCTTQNNWARSSFTGNCSSN